MQDEDNPVPITFHGLRHSYAERQYTQHIAKGRTVTDAKRQVSKSIGHNRPDVTNIYLAGLNGNKRGGDDEE